ncbi:MAG: hypothetical protein ACK559_19725, partial [bacterium]
MLGFVRRDDGQPGRQVRLQRGRCHARLQPQVDAVDAPLQAEHVLRGCNVHHHQRGAARGHAAAHLQAVPAWAGLQAQGLPVAQTQSVASRGVDEGQGRIQRRQSPLALSRTRQGAWGQGGCGQGVQPDQAHGQAACAAGFARYGCWG